MQFFILLLEAECQNYWGQGKYLHLCRVVSICKMFRYKWNCNILMCNRNVLSILTGGSGGKSCWGLIRWRWEVKQHRESLICFGTLWIMCKSCRRQSELWDRMGSLMLSLQTFKTGASSLYLSRCQWPVPSLWLLKCCPASHISWFILHSSGIKQMCFRLKPF